MPEVAPGSTRPITSGRLHGATEPAKPRIAAPMTTHEPPRVVIQIASEGSPTWRATDTGRTHWSYSGAGRALPDSVRYLEPGSGVILSCKCTGSFAFRRTPILSSSTKIENAMAAYT